nr:MAG TPA: hypothetical protein [Caudoviricetes sp.]DAY54528.1 MAG TPA: hypothetical protein [Caudoviricetes sp.]
MVHLERYFIHYQEHGFAIWINLYIFVWKNNRMKKTIGHINLY